MAIAEHLVASTRNRDRSLLQPEKAAWLWGHLRKAIPDALSAVLMPDHLHIVAVPGGRRRLRRILGSFAGRFQVYFDVLDPEPAHSWAIAGRMMRYGFFNPVRAGHVDDPWSWTWSTLRDLTAACHPVWTPLAPIAARFKQPPSRLLRALSSNADHCSPPPTTCPPDVATVDAIRKAVASALRIHPNTILSSPTPRRLLIQAIYELGSPSPRQLATTLGVGERSLHRLRHPRHPALDAVLLCLSDARLRRAHAI